MLWAEIEKVIEAREAEFSLPLLLYLARYFYLEEIDARWIEHLKAMEALREGIGLRGYGQKDPKQEYKKEGFVDLRRDDGRHRPATSARSCSTCRSSRDEAAAPRPPRRRSDARAGRSSRAAAPSRAAASGDGQPGQEEGKTVRRDQPKVGRNDPCPCGSGKKYKKCHGAVAA